MVISSNGRLQSWTSKINCLPWTSCQILEIESYAELRSNAVRWSNDDDAFQNLQPIVCSWQSCTPCFFHQLRSVWSGATAKDVGPTKILSESLSRPWIFNFHYLSGKYGAKVSFEKKKMPNVPVLFQFVAPTMISIIKKEERERGSIQWKPCARGCLHM